MKKESKELLAAALSTISILTLLPVIGASADAFVTITSQKLRGFKGYPADITDEELMDPDYYDEEDDDDDYFDDEDDAPPEVTESDINTMIETQLQAEDKVDQELQEALDDIESSEEDDDKYNHDEEAVTVIEEDPIYPDQNKYTSILQEEEFVEYTKIKSESVYLLEIVRSCEINSMTIEQTRDMLRRSVDRKAKLAAYQNRKGRKNQEHVS